MAPRETPDEATQSKGRDLGSNWSARLSDPRVLTGRERRRRMLILTLLSLLLLLLCYVAYYFSQNRHLPTLGVALPRNDTIAPPEFLYSITGNGPSVLFRPVGVGVADDGRVYVVDFGNHRVSAFTNAGQYLFSFNKTADGILLDPVHLAVKGNEVWVSERHYRAIYIFDLGGQYLRKFEPKNEKLNWTPLAFSFDATGALRATDVGQTDLHRLIYFSADGSRTATIGRTASVKSLRDAPGSFMFPNGVAVARNGEVYVSDGDNRRVQVFNAQGVFERFLDTSGVPRGIAIDSQQRIYVADALAHTVSIYDAKGKTLTQFGTHGFGPGQFNFPNDVTIDRRGRIYISDRENDQVQVWGWPVAQLPAIAVPKSPATWLASLACLIPLLLLPFLLLARRKTRIVVTPDFVDALVALGEMSAVAEKSRLRLVAPVEDRELYEGREVDGVDLGTLITFEPYSESDARSLMDKYRIAARPAMLVAMASQAKALGTDDHELRLVAMLAEVRVVDAEEFGEIYLGHGRGGAK